MTGKRDCRSSDELLELVCDTNSLIRKTTPDTPEPRGVDTALSYSERLRQAREATGRRCALQWGVARIGGNRCVVLANEFGFIAGSLGTAEAGEICRAMDTAAAEHVPFVWLAASGGCRLMEGLPPLLSIPGILAARNRLAAESAPFIAVTVGPHLGADRLITTQADFAVGIENTWLGFVGPKVIEQHDNTALPEGFQTTEWAFTNGQLDQVIALDKLQECLTTLLSVLASPEPAAVVGVPSEPEQRSAWQSVVAARTTKPSARAIYEHMADLRFDLHGDRVSGDDPAVMAGVARVAGRPVAVVGHNAPASPDVADRIAVNFQMPHPSGYRKALRLVALARRLRLPIVTLVDSPGTCPDVESEAGNQPGVLGELTNAMLEAHVPAVGIIVGEAVGAGALPFVTVDRLYMADTSCFGVMAPEGAAAILLGDASRAEEAAELLDMSSGAILAAGAADGRICVDADGRELVRVVVAALDEIGGTPDRRRRLRV